jgi:hypothetical protein
LGVVRIAVLLQQCDRAHDHPGRAVAALESSDFEEGALDRMEVAVAWQSLDGADGMAGRVCRADLTGSNRRTIEEHGTGAACTLAAAWLGAGELELLAEHVEQTPIWLGRQLASQPIHDDLGGANHARTFAFDTGDNQA